MAKRILKIMCLFLKIDLFIWKCEQERKTEEKEQGRASEKSKTPCRAGIPTWGQISGLQEYYLRQPLINWAIHVPLQKYWDILKNPNTENLGSHLFTLEVGWEDTGITQPRENNGASQTISCAWPWWESSCKFVRQMGKKTWSLSAQS